MNFNFIPQINEEKTASSLSFSSDLARGVHARASVECPPVSRLPSRAWSFTGLGRLGSTDQEKERLLIVYVQCERVFLPKTLLQETK